MNRSDKLRLVQAVPFWWHTLDLGDGVITPGQTPVQAQEARLAAVPTDIRGKTLLDVGCWDGYFSFACERLGANVLATDTFQHTEFVRRKYGIELAPGAGFNVARQILASKVDFRQTDLASLLKERFDIVLYLGVLYHTKNPLLALEQLAKLTGEALILESHYIPDANGRAYMQFYAGDEQNEDPTNWWGPTVDCIERMCRVAGFSAVECVRTYYDNDHRVIFRCYR